MQGDGLGDQGILGSAGEVPSGSSERSVSVLRGGAVFEFDRTPENDSFYHLGKGNLVGGGDFPCGEAWDAISRYVYTALQGGSIMKSWTNDDRMMIACCNDGTRPVIFKIERVDTPESDEEAAWLAKQEFSNNKEDAYTG